MKKILIMIMLSVSLFGCSAETSFNDYVSSFAEEDETMSKLDKVLSVIETSDAKIGVSLIENKEGDVILYLSSMMIDKNEGVVFDFHGDHIPLSFYENNDDRIWTWYKLNNEVFKYEKDETSEYKYIYGILDGNKKNIKYDDKSIKQKSVSFVYMNKDVDITLWVLQLQNDKEFDLDKLTY